MFMAVAQCLGTLCQRMCMQLSIRNLWHSWLSMRVVMC